jgi:lysozyme
MNSAHVKLLETQEGFRSKPYQDSVGKLTIGYGTNLDAGISEDQAYLLLNSKVCENLEDLQSYSWFVSLDVIRQGVIENMCYNMGICGFLEFKNMINALIAHDYAAASTEMLNSLWAKQVGQRAVTLANIMVSGEIAED